MPDETKDNGPAKRRWWTTPQAILVGIVAIFAAISTVTGGVSDAYNALAWWKKSHEEPTQFDRTPRLGLQFWQGDRMAPMSEDDAGIVTVRLQRKPFLLRAPSHLVQIHAWDDESLFTARGLFGPATGIADTEFNSGNLVLSKKGHNYLTGNRLRRHGKEYEAYFSRSQKILYKPPKLDAKKPVPFTEQRQPLYLVVFVPPKSQRDVDTTEKIILQF